jgi:hypothetical protein
MLCTGTAFRPPRKDDNEGWVVVERLLTTGFRFFSTSQRRRVPRTLKELEAWIRAREGPDGWLPERRVRIRRDASRPVLRWGQHELVDGRQVLIWHEGDWLEGRVRLLGDGRKVLPNPVVTVRRTRRSVQLTSDVRLRLRANDQV